MISPIVRLMDWRLFKGSQKRPEDRLAIRVADFLRGATLDGYLIATWTHVPNEIGAGNGRLSSVRYGLGKAMGLIPGAPDYAFIWDGGGGWIELKTPQGKQSERQLDFNAWCAATNSGYAVCRSVQDVADTLYDWGALTQKYEGLLVEKRG